MGSRIELLCSASGMGGSRTSMATKPMDMSTATPRNGPRQQRALVPDAAGDHPGNEHRHPGDEKVAGEDQLYLTRRGVELPGNRWQYGVHQPQPHEGHHARERHGPDGPGLPPHTTLYLASGPTFAGGLVNLSCGSQNSPSILSVKEVSKPATPSVNLPILVYLYVHVYFKR
jgi:hypothetical protein